MGVDSTVARTVVVFASTGVVGDVTTLSLVCVVAGVLTRTVELREVQDAMVKSHDRQSVLGDEVTALPTIGCLPERSCKYI